MDLFEILNREVNGPLDIDEVIINKDNFIYIYTYKKNTKILHSINDKPSIKIFRNNNELLSEEYHKNGKLHKDNDKPAIIRYDHSRGNCYVSVELFYKNGKLHRDNNMPAIVTYGFNYDENDNCTTYIFREIWLINGTCMRTDNKATDIQYYSNGNKEIEYWSINNIKNSYHDYIWSTKKLYRFDDLPSVIVYYKNGKIKSELWRSGYYLHRINKPAKIKYDINGEIRKEKYYIDGIRIL